MTALQLNEDIYRNLGIIAEDESMLDRAAKYLRRLVKQMKYDPTCMSKEEFFARIERAEQQYARGEYTTQLPGESVEDMLKRCGYLLSSTNHSHTLIYNIYTTLKAKNRKEHIMTATISYNPRNRAARLAMDYIQSLGVFVINPLPTRSRIKVSNGDVNEQLMNDLKGALREVKDSMDGKNQMKNAYELLNEL